MDPSEIQAYAAVSSLLVVGAIGFVQYNLANQQNTLLEQQNRLAMYDKRYEVNKIFMELVNDLLSINFLDKNKTQEQVFNEIVNITLMMHSKTIARVSLFDSKFNDFFYDKIFQISEICNTICDIKNEYDNNINKPIIVKTCYFKLAEQQNLIVKEANEVSEKMQKTFYLGDIQTKNIS